MSSSGEGYRKYFHGGRGTETGRHAPLADSAGDMQGQTFRALNVKGQTEEQKTEQIGGIFDQSCPVEMYKPKHTKRPCSVCKGHIIL